MADSVQPGGIRTSGVNREWGQVAAAVTDGYVYDPAEPTIAARESGTVDETQFDGFTETSAVDSHTVTIGPGEAQVYGWVARDVTTDIDLDADTNGQVVYIGWNFQAVEEDKAIIGLADAFDKTTSDELPKLPLWEFDTDANGVTSATDLRDIGNTSHTERAYTDEIRGKDGSTVGLGGETLDDVGDLTNSSGIVGTDEIDAAISPTWTGDHTFEGGLTMGGDLDLAGETLVDTKTSYYDFTDNNDLRLSTGKGIEDEDGIIRFSLNDTYTDLRDDENFSRILIDGDGALDLRTQQTNDAVRVNDLYGGFVAAEYMSTTSKPGVFNFKNSAIRTTEHSGYSFGGRTDTALGVPKYDGSGADSLWLTFAGSNGHVAVRNESGVLTVSEGGIKIPDGKMRYYKILGPSETLIDFDVFRQYDLRRNSETDAGSANLMFNSQIDGNFWSFGYKGTENVVFDKKHTTINNNIQLPSESFIVDEDNQQRIRIADNKTEISDNNGRTTFYTENGGVTDLRAFSDQSLRIRDIEQDTAAIEYATGASRGSLIFKSAKIDISEWNSNQSEPAIVLEAGVSLWSEDGELKAQDRDGNVTVLT